MEVGRVVYLIADTHSNLQNLSIDYRQEVNILATAVAAITIVVTGSCAFAVPVLASGEIALSLVFATIGIKLPGPFDVLVGGLHRRLLVDS